MKPEDAVTIGVRIKDTGTVRGRGLFATRPIAKGETIMQLDYETLTKSQLESRYDYGGVEGTGPYAHSFKTARGGQTMYADGLCVRSAPSYANDPKGPRRKLKTRANARHVWIETGNPATSNLWLEAIANIAKDTEIFVDYGHDYWRHHDMIHIRMRKIKAAKK